MRMDAEAQEDSNAQAVASAERHDDEEPVQQKPPLSAYNMFFQMERQRILDGTDVLNLPITNEQAREICRQHKLKTTTIAKNRRRVHRKTHGKIGFADLARTIAQRWKRLDAESRTILRTHAAAERDDYTKNYKMWRYLHRSPSSSSCPTTSTIGPQATTTQGGGGTMTQDEAETKQDTRNDNEATKSGGSIHWMVGMQQRPSKTMTTTLVQEDQDRGVIATTSTPSVATMSSLPPLGVLQQPPPTLSRMRQGPNKTTRNMERVVAAATPTTLPTPTGGGPMLLRGGPSTTSTTTHEGTVASAPVLQRQITEESTFTGTASSSSSSVLLSDLMAPMDPHEMDALFDEEDDAAA